MSGESNSLLRYAKFSMSVGDEQAAVFTLPSPSGSPIGVRVAFRHYLDDVSGGGAISPFTKNSSGDLHHYLYESATWDHHFAMGFGFTDDIPGRDDAQTDGLSQHRGFIGLRVANSGNALNKDNINISNHESNWGIGNVLKRSVFPIASAAENITSLAASAQRNKFSDRPVKQTASGFDTYNNTLDFQSGFYDADPTTDPFNLRAIPSNATEGAKYTLGLELRRNLTNESTTLRWYVNTGSLSEANYGQVFTDYDFVSAANRVSLSSGSVDSDDPFREGGAVFNRPGFFIFKCALPSQVFWVKGFHVEDIYS